MTHALRALVAVAWVTFWAYWLLSARGVKHGTRPSMVRYLGLRVVIVVVVLRVVVGRLGGGTAVPGPAAIRWLGAVLLLGGLAWAVWARVHIGRNWGVPMTRKDEPELVTSGPYRLVRHPIYSGILCGLVGTALALDLYVLIVVAVVAAYFVHSARVEEGIMGAAFPEQYAEYRERTKMLVPFLV